MRRLSKKRAKRDRENIPFLKAYRGLFLQCQNGCGRIAVEIHEIAAGSHREKSRRSRACILNLCNTCHLRLQGLAYDYQLAVKLLADPEGFNLEEFCSVIGRADTAVTLADVAQHLELRA